MESTGVYWIPLYEILDARGFEVVLVNARDVKNVPGRKTDVKDCQWLQQLHSYGLLKASFRPEDHICTLRGFMRQRDNLVKGAGIHVQRMQKALTQMNVQLHKVISDVTGQTGVKIIEAILAGERNPTILAKLRGTRIKNDEATMAKALVGNYREEHLFSLEQEFDLYKIYLEKISQCDERIYKYYQTIESKDGSNRPDDNGLPKTIHDELVRLSGVDFTKIPGIATQSVQVILSEIGLNADKWKTDKHFASWLGLSPANKITGGKVFSTRTRKVNNRASYAFRMAALAAGKSKTSAIGAYYRRLKARLGAPKAITATARKLACLFYNMLKHGQEYVEKGLDYYDRMYQDKLVRGLNKKAQAFGYALVKVTDM
jgi:transposase